MRIAVAGGIGTVGVNGAPGALVQVEGRLVAVMSFAVHDGRVTAIDSVLNPEKLCHVRLPGR